MNTRLTIVAFVAILAATACSSSKKAQENLPPAPTWVANKPTQPGYYIGVGRAPKAGDVNGYRQASKNNALADLGSDISVSISSSSVLHKFESSLKFSEDYSSNIQAESQKDLEGYELVDTYEDFTSSWTYYRLSKSAWQATQERKKSAAVTGGLDLYQRGRALADSDDLKSAFISYLKALESLKPYLGESLQTEYNGKNILLGNEIFDAMTALVKEVKVEAIINKTTVKYGESISSDLLRFKVSNGSSLKLFPVVFSYSAKPIKNSKTITNDAGIASYSLESVNSTKAQEQLFATADWVTMAADATSDMYFRRLAEKFNTPPAAILISIVKPKVLVVSVEKNIGEAIPDRHLASKLSSLLTAEGINQASSQADADFVLTITSDAAARNQVGNLFYAEIVGNIVLTDKEGNTLLMQPLSGINAAHLTYATAGIEAYKRQSEKLGGYIWTQIRDKIIKR